ncbi:hypothetical protein C623_0225740 [Bacillus thuringiensis serovar aizawai str. Hu4-2]|nr:hypothetical protein C623_0225740 [Bacillus thuringiensis serovar aizawai str. Hu4-2]
MYDFTSIVGVILMLGFSVSMFFIDRAEKDIPKG